MLNAAKFQSARVAISVLRLLSYLLLVFAALMIGLFWFGDLTFLPLAEFLHVRPTVAWVLLAGLLAAVIALFHGLIGSRRIAFARQLEFEVSQFEEARKKQEQDMKIGMMREAEQGHSKEDN
ncbi:hypothetical protein [Ruegeria arenilitoris]|uniref:hypothetical protein n=1 Tax=Ruegeria arenilitoris TaxID=1173585 RepID=UPI001481C881|nr:hypothetical protein [Ruegeria arenilitoris]